MSQTQVHEVGELSLRYDGAGCDPHCAAILLGAGDAPPLRIWFRSQDAALRPSGAALLCLGLPAAVEVGAPLRLGTALEPQMRENAKRISDLLCRWYPGLSPLELHAPEGRTACGNGTQTGLFFSAGVDSSYSLVAAHGAVDCLITLIGADIPVGDEDRAARLRQAVQDVAAAKGLRSIIVETNIREVSDRLVGWVEYHGAVLAAVAHLLTDEINRVLIASSADEASWQRPWGTHPDLDPLWGDGQLSIEHHGLAPRYSKVAGIVDDPVLMRHLRVCDYEDTNCGVCPDCIFMLNALAVLDAFGRAPTFSHGRLKRGRVIVDGRGTVTDCLDLKRGALAAGRPAGLPRRIDRAIAGYEVRQTLDRALRLSALKRRFRRAKRRARYRSASRSAGDSRRP